MESDWDLGEPQDASAGDSTLRTSRLPRTHHRCGLPKSQGFAAQRRVTAANAVAAPGCLILLPAADEDWDLTELDARKPGGSRDPRGCRSVSVRSIESEESLDYERARKRQRSAAAGFPETMLPKASKGTVRSPIRSRACIAMPEHICPSAIRQCQAVMLVVYPDSRAGV